MQGLIFYANNTNQYKFTERLAVGSIITKTQWNCGNITKINTEYNMYRL